MTKTIDVIQTSKYIISYLNKKGERINHLKLQKLLYYIEAWYMVFYGENIFSENIEAWEHGPVIRRVWNYFKRYSILYDTLPVDKEFRFKVTPEQLEVINDVLDEYGDKTGYYLECLTHTEKPWIAAKRSGFGIISKDIMKDFYRKKLNGK